MISPRDLRGLRVGSSAALPTAITAAMVSVSAGGDDDIQSDLHEGIADFVRF